MERQPRVAKHRVDAIAQPFEPWSPMHDLVDDPLREWNILHVVINSSADEGDGSLLVGGRESHPGLLSTGVDPLGVFSPPLDDIRS